MVDFHFTVLAGCMLYILTFMGKVGPPMFQLRPFFHKIFSMLKFALLILPVSALNCCCGTIQLAT